MQQVFGTMKAGVHQLGNCSIKIFTPSKHANFQCSPHAAKCVRSDYFLAMNTYAAAAMRPHSIRLCLLPLAWNLSAAAWKQHTHYFAAHPHIHERMTQLVCLSLRGHDYIMGCKKNPGISYRTCGQGWTYLCHHSLLPSCRKTFPAFFKRSVLIRRSCGGNAGGADGATNAIATAVFAGTFSSSLYAMYSLMGNSSKIEGCVRILLDHFDCIGMFHPPVLMFVSLQTVISFCLDQVWRCFAAQQEEYKSKPSHSKAWTIPSGLSPHFETD
jgi:hypothetical protein